VMRANLLFDEFVLPETDRRSSSYSYRTLDLSRTRGMVPSGRQHGMTAATLAPSPASWITTPDTSHGNDRNDSDQDLVPEPASDRGGPPSRSLFHAGATPASQRRTGHRIYPWRGVRAPGRERRADAAHGRQRLSCLAGAGRQPAGTLPDRLDRRSRPPAYRL